MSGSYKKYYSDKVGVKYFPDQRLILLLPKRGINPSKFREIKNRIQTILDIEGANLDKRDGQVFFSIKVSKDMPEKNVEETLRSMFMGGDEIISASDLGNQPEEEEKEEQPQPPPEQAQAQQPQQQIPQMEAYNRLFESTYRTAEYWNALSKVSGKPKQNIDANDVLSIRRKYTKKPQGKRRDLVLRSLDKAMKYFSRRITKEQGPNASLEYKQKYKSIGSLTPHDYAEDRLQQHVSPEQETKDSPEEQFYEPSPVDFSEFFSKQDEDEESDAYEGFETKD